MRRTRTASRRLALVAAAVLTVAAMTISRPAYAATTGYSYAEQQSATLVGGVDGYIRGSTTVAVSGDKFRANWIDLCNSRPTCTAQVQLGVTQGENYGATELHIYLENIWYASTSQSSLCLATSHDFGVPAAANQAYYISYTGTRIATSQCGTTYEYKYAARVGSFTNPPKAYAWMPGPLGAPAAATELHSGDGSSVPQNTDYFGTDDNHNAVASNGIHLLNSGSWDLWTSTEPTSVQSDDPPTFDPIATNWAFDTH